MHMIRYWTMLMALVWTSNVYAEVPEGDFTLTISELSVKESRSDDQPWDVGLGKLKLPDLVALMTVNGQSVLEHQFAKNTALVTDKVTSSSFSFDGQARVRVDITDKDLKDHDPVGSLEFVVTTEALDKVIVQKSDLILSFKVTLEYTRAGREAAARKQAEAQAAQAQKELKNAKDQASAEAESKRAAEDAAQKAKAKAEEIEAKMKRVQEAGEELKKALQDSQEN